MFSRYFKTNQITLADNHKQEMPPRTEIFITVNVNYLPDSSDLIIHSQNITENLRCGNVITQIKNNQINIPVVKISEEKVEIKTLFVNELSYEEYREEKIYVTSTTELQRKVDSDRLSSLRKLIQTEHLYSEEKQSIQNSCGQYSDIFFLEGDRLLSIDAVYHEINTPAAAQPINERPYRLPFKHKQEIKKQVTELAENQIIVPSKSPWNAPLLVVPKKPDSGGKIKYRVCVDFSKLNSISTGDAHPLPNITEILVQLEKLKHYTTLDLAQGYHQVQMHPEQLEKNSLFNRQRPL